MTPPAELTKEGELEAKLFTARELEDPSQAVRVWWGRAWTDDGEEQCRELEDGLRTALESLGLREIEAAQVKEVSVLESAARFPETGTLTFPEAFHNVADSVAALADRPNDFIFTVRLPYSEELDVVLQCESEEAGTICDECDWDSVIPGESCEHYEGQFDIRFEYHVHLVRTDHQFEPGCYGNTCFQLRLY